MKPRIVIIGAGLGGAFAAHDLTDVADVTVVEMGASADLQARVRDVGAPAQTIPHVGSGLGGTTTLWHNGLIEIDAQVFDEAWPFPKSELASAYAHVYPLLAGVSSDVVQQGVASLRQKYLAAGLPDLGLPGLFYPRVRRNAWQALNLDGRVRVVIGEVMSLEPQDERLIGRVRVETDAGTEQIDGDVFVLAAGGLSTPVLLQRLASRLPLPSLAHAGRHYEDHPFAFVGEITLGAPLYRFWNYPVPGGSGNVRMPLVVRQDGLDVSFQIRPAANFYHKTRRDRVRSIVTDIRNNRFNPFGYLRLLTHWDDVLDILSFEFGIHIPTSRYSLLMAAQQPPAPGRAVWEEADPETGAPMIHRKWEFPPEYLATLDRSIETVLGRLGPLVKSVHVFPNWKATLQSGAHHSGTARISASAADGVCDRDCRVHGLENLYVADGSVIPGCGMANTGLTIAAIAHRLSLHLRALTGKPHLVGSPSRDGNQLAV